MIIPSEQLRDGMDMQYLTLTQLRSKLGGRSRASIYRDLAEGRLPLPTKLGRRLYWLEHVVDAWMAEQIRGTQPRAA
jgi:prophage regulatory protein